MILKTLVIAALMIAIGVYGYTSQDPDKGPVSPTAAMPAALGALFAVCALIALSPSKRKHAMHAVAVLSLLGAVGSLYPIGKTLAKGDDLVVNAKFLTSLGSSLLCLTLLILCVKSFVAARKARRTLSANPF